MNLKSLVRTDLESRWFHFDSDLDITTEKDAVLSLKLEYQTPDAIQRFVEKATERKAVSKKGLKQFVASQGSISKKMARAALQDWKMTLRGCMAIKAQFNFDGVDLDTVVAFNGENLTTLIEHSELATLINGTATDYEAWFGVSTPEPEEDEEVPTNTADGLNA